MQLNDTRFARSVITSRECTQSGYLIMALQNRYWRRSVADSASKACFICFKPTSTVLITPDNRDFFYVCPGHLNDKGFAQPLGDSPASASSDGANAETKVQNDELEEEIEKVKQGYAEKMKKREEKRNRKDDKNAKEDAAKKELEQTQKEEKERDDKIESIKKQQNPSLSQDNSTDGKDGQGSRVFVLHK